MRPRVASPPHRVRSRVHARQIQAAVLTLSLTLLRDHVRMEQPGLIGDIGGTNARFALTDLASPTPDILHEQTFGDDRFATLREAASHYLEQVGVQPKCATLAVAAPIGGDEISFANRAWSFKCSELQSALSLDHLHLINDFGAIAWAAPQLDI